MLPDEEGAGTIRVPMDKLYDSDVEGCELINTEWHFDDNSGIVECKGQTVHAAQIRGLPHKVYVDTNLKRSQGQFVL